MKKILLATFLLLSAVCLQAQVYPPTLGGLPTATFAAPPSSPKVGSPYFFTDASAVGACTGGGTSYAVCAWNGSSWQASSGTSTGLGDPGSNGIVYRNGLGTTTLANANLLSGALYGAGGGTAQAHTVTLSPAASSLTNLSVCWLPAAANTAAAPTLAVNSLTATAITKFGTVALVANDITTAAIACAKYDGTEFQLQNPQTAIGNVTTSGTPAANQIAMFSAAGAITGITGVNNAVFSTTSGGVPQLSTTLPSGLAMQTPASLTLTNATGLPNAGLVNSAITFGATPQALGSTVTNLNAVNVGPATPGTGAFTTLSASGSVSGAGITSLFASPPALGSTAPAAVNATTLSATGTVSGTGITNLFASPPSIGNTTPGTGAFTTLSATGAVSGAGITSLFASPPSIGGTSAGSGSFTTLTASSTVNGAGITSLFASPPTIGGTVSAAGTFTALTATGAFQASSTAAFSGVASFSSGNITLPAATGFTATITNNVGRDLTSNNDLIWANGASSIIGTLTGTFANNDCVAAAVVGSNIQLKSAGAACGSGSGGVTSITGDLAGLISNSGSTGAVTLTLGAIAAHAIWGNHTGSSATPTAGLLATADLPAATVFNNQANTWTGAGLQSMAAVDWLAPSHASDPLTCSAGQFEFNTSGSFKGCTAANSWVTFSTGANTTFEVNGGSSVSASVLNFVPSAGILYTMTSPGGVATLTASVDTTIIASVDGVHANYNSPTRTSTGLTALTYTSNTKPILAYATQMKYDFNSDVANPVSIAIDSAGVVNLKASDCSSTITSGTIGANSMFSAWYNGTNFCLMDGSASSTNGTVNTGTAGHLGYYATSTNAISDMGADFTFATHTLTGGASSILDLHAAATSGFLLPGGMTTGVVTVTTTTGAISSFALGTGVQTFLTTPSGANLASALTTAIPISVGGINATSAAAGTVPNATSGTAASWTKDITLGASGTSGSITMGNATSGLLTIQPATGALGTVTASFPANTGTVAETNLSQTWTNNQSFSGTLSVGGVLSVSGTETVTGTLGASGAAHTTPEVVVATVGALPATCAAGELGFVTGATAGQQIYECSATNTWTQQLNSGGGGSPPWNSIVNPSGASNLALTMSAITSTFNYATPLAGAFVWANTAAAVTGVNQSSPILNVCGQDFVGATPANTQDCFTAQVVLPNGNNEIPSLTFGSNTSSTNTNGPNFTFNGTLTVIPANTTSGSNALCLENNGGSACEFAWRQGSGGIGNFYVLSGVLEDGNTFNWKLGNGASMRLGSGTGFIWVNNTNVEAGAADTSLTRQGAGVLQLGGATAGNAGSLLLTGLTAGTDNTTSGSVQIANGSAAAHTIWTSAATTSNTIAGFATAPATSHLVSCTTSGTTCTLTSSSITDDATTASLGSNFTVTESSGLMTKIDGISTASTSTGVGVIVADSPLTNSSATSAVTLATAPGAGDYIVNYNLDLHTACTTGSETVSLQFGWTANAARTYTTGNWTIGTAQNTTGGNLYGWIMIHVVSGNVTFTPAASGCATGTATWDGDIDLVRVH